MRYICFLLFLLQFPLQAITAALVKPPIRVLLISGSNNHDWKATSPVFKELLEEKGFFSVDITEKPDTLNTFNLKKYQAIASNWNAFPSTERKWGAVSEKAILNFVNEGGGFVLFHAASAAHCDWPQFQQMIGATWGKNTHHGKISSFEVKIQDTKHPITRGMSNFMITDELWVEMDQQKGNIILGTGFAPLSNKGRNQDEPVIICRKQGKGRCFNLVLGHDVAAMRNIGWKTLMQRGTEWAATERVTQEIPPLLLLNKKKKNMFWDESSNYLALVNQGKIIWKFNYEKEEGKPYIHPLATINGSVLTELRPSDHPWHRGVWFSWKYINGLNYWEEDRTTGRSEGITELKSVSVKKEKNFEAEFRMELSYHPKNTPDILKEDRIVTISTPKEDGSYFMVWESKFTALVDEVVLDRTPLPHEANGKSWGGYAGFSVRLNNQLQEVSITNYQEQKMVQSGSQSPWVTFQMKDTQSNYASVSIFDHPKNRKYPSKWYLTNNSNIPFYYFSPSILYDAKMVLQKNESFIMKYGLLVQSGFSESSKLQSVWKNFKKK